MEGYMKPHKHCEVIKAWADGAEIQFWDGELWCDVEIPYWDKADSYRIKPQPKPDVVKYANLYPVSGRASFWTELMDAKSFCDSSRVAGRLKLTFDGETITLKSAEVL
jgi:hypothetical protein